MELRWHELKVTSEAQLKLSIETTDAQPQPSATFLAGQAISAAVPRMLLILFFPSDDYRCVTCSQMHSGGYGSG
jgi:hypothetical protein